MKATQPCMTLCNPMDYTVHGILQARIQGIFPTQGSNPGLPQCRWILHQLSHKGSPCFWKSTVTFFFNLCRVLQSFPSFTGSAVKNPPANAGDAGLIPGLGRSPGGGNGNSLQCSCLGNPMDRGAWRATVHGILKSGQEQLSNSIEFCSLQSTPTFL